MTRVAVLVAVSFVLLTVLAVFQLALGTWQATVDVPTLVVLYRVLTEAPRVRGARPHGRSHLMANIDGHGVILVLVLGYLNDVLAGLPKGSSSLVLGAFYLLAAAVVRWVDLRGVARRAAAGGVASLMASILGLTLRSSSGAGVDWHLAGVVLGQAVLTAAAAPIVMRLLAAVDEPLGQAAGPLRARPF